MVASDLGSAITRLSEIITNRKGAAPSESYTASLLAAGPQKCAKKFGEEAVELVMAASGESAERVAAEAADVLYHLLVLLAASGVDGASVAAALAAREGQSGHTEKASRK